MDQTEQDGVENTETEQTDHQYAHATKGSGHLGKNQKKLGTGFTSSSEGDMSCAAQGFVSSAAGEKSNVKEGLVLSAGDENRDMQQSEDPELLAESGSEKGAYRMLVQRKSGFDKLGTQGLPVPEDDGVGNFHCGYCLDTFSDEDAMMSHLLIHDTATQKSRRQATTSQQKPELAVPVKSNLRKRKNCKLMTSSQNSADHIHRDNKLSRSSLNESNVSKVAKKQKHVKTKKAASPRTSRKIKNTMRSPEVMASVGKRRAKKSLGDDFVTFEYKRNNKINSRPTLLLTHDVSNKAEKSLNRSGENLPPKQRKTLVHRPDETLPTGTSGISKYPEHLSVLKCVTCQACFLWKQPFLNHLKIHPSTRPYECLVCHKRFASFLSHLKHSKQVHNDGQEHTCSECGKFFHTEESLKLHLNRHNGGEISIRPTKLNSPIVSDMACQSKNNSKNSKSTAEASTPFLCRPCGKYFSDRRNLWIHEKRHPNAVKPYSCHICHRKFALHKWLTEHLQRHNPVRRYPCSVCGKHYFTKSDARMHEQRHTKPATFECKKCHKKFIYKSELNSHLKRHEGVRLPRNIECKDCGKLFYARRDLERHMTVHTGERAFTCPVCSKQFSQEINMQVHMKIHTNDRPFQCDLCHKRFIVKSKLIRHQLCHTSTKAQLPRPYKCILCPRRYTTENILIRHLRTHKHSLQSVSDITTALHKAVSDCTDVENSVKTANQPGAFLACLIDQAISDARRTSRQRAKLGRGEESSVAEIIDQAIHQSKTSSSTQTPLEESMDKTPVRSRLSPLHSTGETLTEDSTANDNPGTSSCSDLIRLISDSLRKHSSTEAGQVSTSNPAGSVETVIVRPTGPVVNPGPAVAKAEKGRVQTQHNIIGKSGLEVSTSCHSVSGHQEVSLLHENMSIIPLLKSETNAYSSSDDLLMATSSNPTSLTGPVYEWQVALQSHGDSSAISVAAPAHNQIVDLPLQVEQTSNLTIQTLENASQSQVSALTNTTIKDETVSVGTSSYELLSDSDVISSSPATTSPVQHIIVKTGQGQTFLIPSSLLSLDQSYQIVQASSSPSNLGDVVGSCTS